jgi:hypothetical protein
MTREEAGSFFQDETKLETNPKVGYKALPRPGTCWIAAISFLLERYDMRFLAFVSP